MGKKGGDNAQNSKNKTDKGGRHNTESTKILFQNFSDQNLDYKFFLTKNYFDQKKFRLNTAFFTKKEEKI